MGAQGEVVFEIAKEWTNWDEQGRTGTNCGDIPLSNREFIWMTYSKDAGNRACELLRQCACTIADRAIGRKGGAIAKTPSRPRRILGPQNQDNSE